jgi:hypothetical protein
MRKTILIFGLVAGMVSVVSAQLASNSSAPEEDGNCYVKWTKKFEARGADAVGDGTYTDVIITIRNLEDNMINCFVGKCDVKGGRVTAMYLKLDDGKYEQLVRKPRYEQSITINNGMSKPYITIDDDIINVLFIKKLKPKKAEFQKAPNPDDE